MTDLDDFFAKKDKNRKKKLNRISNEDFVQKYEAKCKEYNFHESKSAQTLNNLEGFVQDDGEWKDFEDDEKDYSGLKIQALSLSEEDQREKDDEDNNKETVEMPWGKKDVTETTDTADVAPKAELTESELQIMKIKQILMSKMSANLKLNDAVEFPDLGATPEAIEDAKTFQTVRSSGASSSKAQLLSDRSRNQIATENKFSALRNN
ncbi:Coiled-coil domain-containing protein 130-like protein [Sarcoptes scabiei]|uniref:Carnitine deficiency-associated protein 3-like protein n=1 Tax=Sarcoptes scabiei TaxID=52283 RepID=A0A131ZYJ6_SARSC|nr:Carnitine deficiency-associated protein 3-like protein [Sarcoptes scabiei]UXI17822.1 Coiled-coil domain-containing protein 130-like protein [Sarcoptes scabiei]